MRVMQATRLLRIQHRNSIFVVYFLLALAALILYVLIPQAPSFRQGLRSIRTADVGFIELGALFTLGTYLAAALVYHCLSTRPLSYSRTVLVQVAGSFANRLLPAGAGAISVSARYLTKQHFSNIQAGTLVAVNNILGLVGNMLLFGLIVIFSGKTATTALKIKLPATSLIIIVAVVSLLIFLLFLVRRFRKKLALTARKTRVSFKQILASPKRLLLALTASMLMTSFYGLTLYAVEQSLNVHLSLVQVFIVFSAGVVAAALTPTPGGLGGAEAGLTAAFVSVGLPAPQALTIAVTFRFLTYWLPLMPGFVCFQLAARKGWI